MKSRRGSKIEALLINDDENEEETKLFFLSLTKT